jgi:hypothetical protein
MTVLNTGTGATLKATTYEGAIEELCARIAAAQDTTANNPQNIKAVTFTTDSRTNQTSYEFSLPLIVAVSGNSRSFTASDYLTGVTYSSGTGALTGGNMLQDLVNLLFDLQKLEKDPIANPTQADRLTLNIDEEWVLTASLNLQTNAVINASGKREYTAIAYLA